MMKYSRTSSFKTCIEEDTVEKVFNFLKGHPGGMFLFLVF